MSDQTYRNHKMYVPAYHYYATGLILVVFAWAVYRAVTAFSVDRLMIVLLVVALVAVFFFSRLFALRAQDRVIRLEEQLRMARVLPPALAARVGELSVGQFVALRFASDAELPELVTKVLDQNLRNGDQIKQMIRTWRPDSARF
jgi:hypothetical protein